MRICPLQLSEFIVSETKMTALICVTLTATILNINFM